MPGTRREFWEKKLAGNVERDERNSAALKELGWKVIVIWECEIGDTAQLARRLGRLLARKV